MKYYAIVSPGSSREDPAGQARRHLTAEGNLDEHLSRKLTWEPTSAIVEWELGDVGAALLLVSEAEAKALVERWRTRWQATDQK